MGTSGRRYTPEAVSCGGTAFYVAGTVTVIASLYALRRVVRWDLVSYSVPLAPELSQYALWRVVRRNLGRYVYVPGEALSLYALWRVAHRDKQLAAFIAGITPSLYAPWRVVGRDAASRRCPQRRS